MTLRRPSGYSATNSSTCTQVHFCGSSERSNEGCEELEIGLRDRSSCAFRAGSGGRRLILAMPDISSLRDCRRVGEEEADPTSVDLLRSSGGVVELEDDLRSGRMLLGYTVGQDASRHAGPQAARKSPPASPIFSAPGGRTKTTTWWTTAGFPVRTCGARTRRRALSSGRIRRRARKASIPRREVGAPQGNRSLGFRSSETMKLWTLGHCWANLRDRIISLNAVNSTRTWSAGTGRQANFRRDPAFVLRGSRG